MNALSESSISCKSVASWQNLFKYDIASCSSILIIGRGGTVLARRRWILPLKASSTGFPRCNDFCMRSIRSSVEARLFVDRDCARTRSRDRYSRMWRRKESLLRRAALRGSSIDSASCLSHLIASSRTTIISSTLTLESSFLLYSWVLKSSSYFGQYCGYIVYGWVIQTS